MLASCVWLTLGSSAAAGEPDRTAALDARYHLPTLPDHHTHARALLANALRYVAPGNGMIDKVSGYPVEGWNQDPAKGLFLRSFTQLTAIGQGLELFANVAAGYVATPDLSLDEALKHLSRMIKSLRDDQRDPRLSARGLLGNFLDLATGKRLGPLASDVDKTTILEAFGHEKGEAIWKALLAKGWLVARNHGREGAIQRIAGYGGEHFDGPLAPFADTATKEKLMAILDHRVVMIVLGDNANLSASVAKSIGALLHPSIKDRPGVEALRSELESFLDDQKTGYARLYDAQAGLLNFGWDATRDRLFGWEDLQGNWKTGHMDYLVNEFRGPVTFVVLRFGLPDDAIKNLGFKMKPYLMHDGRTLHALAPWEGSAFQALGLGLSLGELDNASWRRLLGDIVRIEVDYATRKSLPGFLSESYTGDGVQYTGNIGIPEITVAPRPRITDAASLYTLGVAYSIAPDELERFLAKSWPVIAKLLTDHGPWEGYNTTRRKVIQFQTSAHTLSLILGLLGTGSENMKRYLESKGLLKPLHTMCRPSEDVDLMASETNIFAWDDKEVGLRGMRERNGFHVAASGIHHPGIAFVSTRKQGVNLSGGLLTFRYRSTAPIDPAVITLKPATRPAVDDLIPIELFGRLDATGDRDAELRIPLPATPGLTQIKEVVVTCGDEMKGKSIDLTITGLCGRPQ